MRESIAAHTPARLPACSCQPVDSNLRASHPVVRPMWGYAEGNPTIVGIVVVIIGLAAVGYIVRRLLRRGR